VTEETAAPGPYTSKVLQATADHTAEAGRRQRSYSQERSLQTVVSIIMPTKWMEIPIKVKEQLLYYHGGRGVCVLNFFRKHKFHRVLNLLPA